MFYFRYQLKIELIPYVQTEIHQYLKMVQKQLPSMPNQKKLLTKKVIYRKLKQIEDFYDKWYIDFRTPMILRSRDLLLQFMNIHSDKFPYVQQAPIKQQKIQKQKLDKQKDKSLKISSVKGIQGENQKKLQKSSSKTGYSSASRLVNSKFNQAKEAEVNRLLQVQKSKQKQSHSQRLEKDEKSGGISEMPTQNKNKSSGISSNSPILSPTLSPRPVQSPYISSRQKTPNTSPKPTPRKSPSPITKQMNQNKNLSGLIKRERAYTYTEETTAINVSPIHLRENVNKKYPISVAQQKTSKGEPSRKITREQYIKYLKTKDGK